MSTLVRPATAAETPAAVAVLARAFHDHPGYGPEVLELVTMTRPARP